MAAAHTIVSLPDQTTAALPNRAPVPPGKPKGMTLLLAEVVVTSRIAELILAARSQNCMVAPG